jgi:hypothetical protein
MTGDDISLLFLWGCFFLREEGGGTLVYSKALVMGAGCIGQTLSDKPRRSPPARTVVVLTMDSWRAYFFFHRQSGHSNVLYARSHSLFAHPPGVRINMLETHSYIRCTTEDTLIPLTPLLPNVRLRAQAASAQPSDVPKGLAEYP